MPGMRFRGWNRAVALVAVLALSPASAAAQAADPAEAPPRTAWGDPDLQGVWDYSTITPMQRCAPSTARPRPRSPSPA